MALECRALPALLQGARKTQSFAQVSPRLNKKYRECIYQDRLGTDIIKLASSNEGAFTQAHEDNSRGGSE
eukprot:COSAG06_NODE_42662_length_379_cov_1.353571_1_plen_69_part_10